MPPKKVMQSYSESSKLAERLYPQLLQTTVCLNVPSWFSMVVKVSRSPFALSFSLCSAVFSSISSISLFFSLFLFFVCLCSVLFNRFSRSASSS